MSERHIRDDCKSYFPWPAAVSHKCGAAGGRTRKAYCKVSRRQYEWICLDDEEHCLEVLLLAGCPERGVQGKDRDSCTNKRQ